MEVPSSVLAHHSKFPNCTNWIRKREKKNALLEENYLQFDCNGTQMLVYVFLAD